MHTQQQSFHAGPYLVKGYELPDNCYTAVKQSQEAYFDTGLNGTALESRQQ